MEKILKNIILTGLSACPLLAFAGVAHAQDADGDGILDGADNCPSVANAGQENTDIPVVYNLTDNSAQDYGPIVSPDGTKVVFTTDNYLYIMNADGTGLSQLTGIQAWSPSYSPDGTKIAFTSSSDGDNEIYTINTNGTSLLKLTNNSTGDQYPRFSPDGTKILFLSERDGDTEIFTMDTAGGSVVQLTINTVYEYYANYSPDGTKIVYVTTPGSADLEIAIMDSDGSNQTVLTVNSGGDSNPAVSPDGTKILYQSDAAGSTGIYTMDIDGTNVDFLIGHGGGSAVYNSDGTKILFEMSQEGANFYTMDTDGTNIVMMTPDDYFMNVDDAIFSPVDNDIIFFLGNLPTGQDDYEVFKVDRNLDSIGDACDCQAEGFCTAQFYCEDNSTTDADCAPDDDRDGIPDATDNCTTVSNPLQENTDGPNLINLTNNSTYDGEGGSIGPDGKIYYSSDGGVFADAEIYAMNADGSNKTDLTNNHDGWDGEPQVSADGTKITFVSNRDGNSEIYVMNIDGSNQTRLTSDPGTDANPSFSPADNTQITYYGYDGNDNEIYMVDTDNPLNPIQLTSNSYDDYSPRFNATGTLIAYWGYESDTEIFTIDPSVPLSPTRLTDNTSSDTSAFFNPADATQIFFTSDRTGHNQIYTLDTDSPTIQTNLSNHSYNDYNPIISSNGGRIAFISDRNQPNSDIFVMDTDGSDQARVTEHNSYHTAFAFSPDASKIAFYSEMDGDLDLYYTNVLYDMVGNACDCQADLLCTAQAYCLGNSTPDADCGSGIENEQSGQLVVTCPVAGVYGLSISSAPADVVFTNTQSPGPGMGTASSLDAAIGAQTDEITLPAGNVLTISDGRSGQTDGCPATTPGFTLSVSATDLTGPVGSTPIGNGSIYIVTTNRHTLGGAANDTTNAPKYSAADGSGNRHDAAMNFGVSSGLKTFSTYSSALGNLSASRTLVTKPTGTFGDIYVGTALAIVDGIAANQQPGTYSGMITYTLSVL